QTSGGVAQGHCNSAAVRLPTRECQRCRQPQAEGERTVLQNVANEDTPLPHLVRASRGTVPSRPANPQPTRSPPQAVRLAEERSARSAQLAHLRAAWRSRSSTLLHTRQRHVRAVSVRGASTQPPPAPVRLDGSPDWRARRG